MKSKHYILIIDDYVDDREIVRDGLVRRWRTGNMFALKMVIAFSNTFK